MGISFLNDLFYFRLVIASEAKQSKSGKQSWIASSQVLLAMTYPLN